MTKELATAVSALWRDPGVQAAFEHQNQFQLNDSAKYFFDRIDEVRLVLGDFRRSLIIIARSPPLVTSQVSRTYCALVPQLLVSLRMSSLSMEPHSACLTSEASAMSARSLCSYIWSSLPLILSPFSRWIHCFENVTAVIFVAALSEYNQTLYEDESQNRLTESLALFEEICNSKYFRTTSMVCFCTPNKKLCACVRSHTLPTAAAVLEQARYLL